MDLSFRRRIPDDDEPYLEIRNAIQHDRAPVTLVEHRHWLDTLPQDEPLEMIVAEREGRLVGTASWMRRLFDVEPNTYWLDIIVDPHAWGQGIGSRIYNCEIERMATRGARKVFGVVREDLPAAEAFLRRRGFERTGHGDRISQLDVAGARLDRCQAAARRVEEAGLRIATLAELGTDEALLRSICDLDNASARHVPSATEFKPIPFEQWTHYVFGGPGQSLDTFWVAMDRDRPVGLAILQMRAGNAADNAYTGVHPEYHGRGIARALKLRTVEWARAHGVRAIMTGNDPSNAPMLAINVDLGYTPLPANVEMVKVL